MVQVNNGTLRELLRLRAATDAKRAFNAIEIPNADRNGQDNPSAIRHFYFWPNTVYTDYEIPYKGEGLYVPNGLLPANYIGSGAGTYAYATFDKLPNGVPITPAPTPASFNVDNEIVPLVGGLSVSIPFSRVFVNMNMGITFGSFYQTAANMNKSLSTPLIVAITRDARLDISRYHVVDCFSMAHTYTLDTVARVDTLSIPVPLEKSRLTLQISTTPIVNPAVVRVYSNSQLVDTQVLPLGAANFVSVEYEDSSINWSIEVSAGGAAETGIVVTRVILEKVR